MPTALSNLLHLIQNFSNPLVILVRRELLAFDKEYILPSPPLTRSRVDAGKIHTKFLEYQQSVCQCAWKILTDSERDQSLFRRRCGRGF